MARDHEIANIVAGLMHRYQKENNVENECVTNVQYLFDQLHSLGIKCKASPAIVMCEDAMINMGHVVIILDDGSVIDPSYEIAKLQNIQYYDNIKTFINIFHKECFEDEETKDVFKNIIKHFISFNNLANRINDSIQTGKTAVVCDNKHYHKQADYIDIHFSHYFFTYLQSQENQEKRENQEKVGYP